MAKAGKSALEIAEELGVVQEADENFTADEKRGRFVSQKVSQYRNQLKEAALEVAKERELSQEDTDKLVEQYTSKLPSLRAKKKTAELVSFLDDLLAECDADPEDETEAPE
jgi:hypothetical protein